MDEKLAHGIARSHLRKAWKASDVSLAANTAILLPYVTRMRQRGKLSRDDAKSLDRAYNSAGAGVWTSLWRNRFRQQGVKSLSSNFGIYTTDLGLAPARIVNGPMAGDMMLEVQMMMRALHRDRILFRNAITPIQIKHHALARFLQRGETVPSKMGVNFAGSLAILLAMAEDIGLSMPFVLPHDQGLFLGVIEKHPNYDEIVKCHWSEITLEDADSGWMQYAFGKSRNARPIISTFLSTEQLNDDQIELRQRFLNIIQKFEVHLLWRAVDEYLIFNSSEINDMPEAVKEDTPAELQQAISRLFDDGLWDKVVRMPKRYNGAAVITLS